MSNNVIPALCRIPLASIGYLVALIFLIISCSTPIGVQSNNPSQIRNANCQSDVLLLTSAFTPNNDGVNDTWKPRYVESVDNIHVKVFSRFGVLIFESKDINFEWDGRDVKGVISVADAYAFLVKYTFKGAMNECRGTVTLVR